MTIFSFGSFSPSKNTHHAAGIVASDTAVIGDIQESNASSHKITDTASQSRWGRLIARIRSLFCRPQMTAATGALGSNCSLVSIKPLDAYKTNYVPYDIRDTSTPPAINQETMPLANQKSDSLALKDENIDEDYLDDDGNNFSNTFVETYATKDTNENNSLYEDIDSLDDKETVNLNTSIINDSDDTDIYTDERGIRHFTI